MKERDHSVGKARAHGGGDVGVRSLRNSVGIEADRRNGSPRGLVEAACEAESESRGRNLSKPNDCDLVPGPYLPPSILFVIGLFLIFIM